MKILIIGCGDIGTAVAYKLIEKGYVVSALKRNPPLKEDGVSYIKADILDKVSLQGIEKDFEKILYILSPDSRSEEDYKKVFDEGLENVLGHFSENVFTFISSSVVHQQTAGEWVDEESIMIATNMRSEVLQKAEEKVLSHNLENSIIRFSGIYGRGGNHLLKKLKNGEAMQYSPPYFTNLIHKEDCVGVIVFIMTGQFEERVFIASDRNPMPLYDVACLVAKEHNLPLPKKNILASDAKQNKRLSSERLVKLGYQFIYPSYHAKREENILFYDGECGFCHGIVQFLLARDKNWLLYFAPLYGAVYQEKKVKRIEEESIIVYREGKETLYKSDAVIYTLELLGAKWEMVAKMMKIFPKFIRDFVYDVIGKIRYHLAGKIDKEACPLMPTKHQERMLA